MCSITVVSISHQLPKHHVDTMPEKKPNWVIVEVSEAERFITDCLLAVGASKQCAQTFAQSLNAADRRGFTSEGITRLQATIADIRNKKISVSANPTVLKATPATAWVDGHNCLGPIVGEFCMRLAMEKAHHVGIGWVVARKSNHIGFGALFSTMAAKQNLIGLTMCNTEPVMCPTRAKHAALGANPISFAVKADLDEVVVLDMATTTVSKEKLESESAKRIRIPPGWALDCDGKITTDPEVAVSSNHLFPLGGNEETGGYKGYGLALMIEMLCGILGGANVGPFVPSDHKMGSKMNLGQTFVAIDPHCFAPMFEGRMTQIIDHLRLMEPINPKKPVLIPGDVERRYMQAVEEEGGFRFTPDLVEMCENLSNQLEVKKIEWKQVTFTIN